MKVIDLLNKIAKGEEVPEKVKFEDCVYKLQKDTIVGTDYSDGDKFLIADYINNKYCIQEVLNDEIEIIEEEKEDNFSGIKYFTDGNCWLSIASEPPKTQDITIEKDIEEINKSYPIFHFDEKSFEAMKDMVQDIYGKQCEIIRKVNKLKKSG